MLILIALLFGFLTKSRAATYILISELLLFLVIILFRGFTVPKKITAIFLLLSLFVLLITFLNISGIGNFNIPERNINLSNIARLGSQVTAINIGLKYPISGVGLGQYGFYMPDFMPAWSKISYEMNYWSSPIEGTPWPPVHGLWARVFCETGIIGLILWSSIWISTLISIWKQFLNIRLKDNQTALLLVVLMISIMSFMLIGFISDTFRPMYYWLTLGISWAWLTKIKHENKINQKLVNNT